MPDNTLIQVNFRPGTTLINGYAADEAELGEVLDLLACYAGQIMQTEALLADAARAAGVLAAAGVAPSPQGQQQAGQGRQAPPTAGPAPSCPHGVMVYNEGQKKNGGGVWRAWDCPAKGSAVACTPDRKWIR